MHALISEQHNFIYRNSNPNIFFHRRYSNRLHLKVKEKEVNNHLGILLEYVLNNISKKTFITKLKKQEIDETILTDLNFVENCLEYYTHQYYHLAPPKKLKTKILNTIKILNTKPPLLSKTSKINDYKKWLDVIVCPNNFENVHTEEIGSYENSNMVIAWIKEGEPNHLHSEYTENFLIVEGSCTASINGVKKDYKEGDYVSFPINQEHGYVVTSKIPMKVVASLVFKAA